VTPNVGAKGDSGGVTPGPEDRTCTPYLASGPGGTPLLLPLERLVRRHLSRRTSLNNARDVLRQLPSRYFHFVWSEGGNMLNDRIGLFVGVTMSAFSWPAAEVTTETALNQLAGKELAIRLAYDPWDFPNILVVQSV
jgi:hypothetical protein